MGFPLKAIRSSQFSKRKPMKPTKRRPQKRKNEKLGTAAPPSNQNSKIPAKISELPPNETLKKLHDEIYGDTEIPRKQRNLY
jgi:hypothetical protein